MILVLFRQPEIRRLLQSAPPTVLLRPLGDADSLPEFQRCRIRAVLCEWDEAVPPAAALSKLFPEARLAAISTRFDTGMAARSRQKGFSDHFFLPLPENFFAELERANPHHPSDSQLALCARVLELLEKQRDYPSVCNYVSGTVLDGLTGVRWSVHVQDKDDNWKMVFASAGWTVDSSRLLPYLARFTGGQRLSPRADVLSENLWCVPLIKNGTVSGAICCESPLAQVSAYSQRLEEVAVFLGSAFHHIDLLIEKERLTFTDTLTGLYNYHYLRQFLLNEIRRCFRYNRSVSILFIDIDWFKQVNDNHGHMAGSDTLVEISRQFPYMVRESDVVVRYGGDEFVIVLTETNPGGARAIAERVRKSVESHVFGTDKGRNIRITVSIGIAGYPDNGFSVDELIRKADGAMYEAKNLNKNKVMAAV